MKDEKADLAILAAYPPPYGGVATHVRRLCPLLEKRGIRYMVYNAVSESEAGDHVVSVARKPVERPWNRRP